MIIVIISLIIGFTTMITISALKQNRVMFKIFHVIGGASYSMVDKLKSIIERKLNNEIRLLNFIDRQVFDELGLIEAAVFVLKAKNLNEAHLKLYIKALEKINK